MVEARLVGYDAIEAAEQMGLRLSKAADPIEGAREGLTPDEARQIAAEDQSLISLDGNVRLLLDEENNAEAWWDAAREREAERPEGARPLLSCGGPDSLTVSAPVAAAFVRWASALPGWDDGPAHAPRPVLVRAG